MRQKSMGFTMVLLFVAVLVAVPIQSTQAQVSGCTQAATLTIQACTSAVFSSTELFRLKLRLGQLPVLSDCNPIDAPSGDAILAECEVDLAEYSAMTDASCVDVPSWMVDNLAACINTWNPSVLVAMTDASWVTMTGASMLLTSTGDFYGGICGDAVGISCATDTIWPLSDGCSIILPDSGIEISWALAECPLEPTATPTPTELGPTETFTPEPTPTNTACMLVAGVTMEFSCADGVYDTTGVDPFRLSLLSGMMPGQIGDCDTWQVDCDEATHLADIFVDPSVDFMGLDCAEIQSWMATEIQNAVAALPGVHYRLHAPGVFVLESCSDFYWTVCSAELGMPCDESLCRPINGCPLVNFGDGIPGNEDPLENDQTGGIGIAITDIDVADYTPTPTQTGTNTLIPTVTNTVDPLFTVTPTFTETGFEPTETPVGPSATFTPIPTETPGCDSGYFVLDSFGNIHRVGNPADIVNGWSGFGQDTARDMERIISTTGYDLLVLDKTGQAHFVASPDSITQDFNFPASAEFPRGRAVDIEVAADSQGFWVLTDFGGIYRAGSVKDASDTALVPNTDQTGVLGWDIPVGEEFSRPAEWPYPGKATLRAVSLVVIDPDQDSRADGYIVMDSMGGHYQINPDGTPVSETDPLPAVNDPMRLLHPNGYEFPFFEGLDIARDMELHPSMQGLLIVDGWDGTHPVPVDIETNPVFFANNLVAGASVPTLITTTGMPYVTKGYDELINEASPSYPLDPDLAPDAGSIFVDAEFSTCGDSQGWYAMDRFGMVFSFGDARPVDDEPTPKFVNMPYWFPELIAEDLEVFGADEAATIIQTATVTFGGVADILTETPFSIRVFRGTAPNGCDPVACPVEDAMVDCVIDLANVAGGSGADAAAYAATTLAACVEGELNWYMNGAGVIVLWGEFEFYVTICSEELMLPCGDEMCQPLTEACPVTGLGGGGLDVDYESSTEIVNPEPSPTPTNTEIPQPTATNTEVVAPTETPFEPTPTFTETEFVETPTYTPEPTFTLTPTATETGFEPTATATQAETNFGRTVRRLSVR